MTSEQVQWEAYPQAFDDIVFEKAPLGSGYVAKLTINRPEVHNAFTPLTVQELRTALQIARDDQEVGVIILTGAGGKAFALVVTSGCARTVAMSAAKTAMSSRASTCLISSAKFAAAPSPSSPWWLAGPSAAGMFYMSFATSPLPLRMRALAKPDLRWAALTAAMAPVIWRALSAKRKPAKFGLPVANTTPSKPWTWAWSTKSYP